MSENTGLQLKLSIYIYLCFYLLCKSYFEHFLFCNYMIQRQGDKFAGPSESSSAALDIWKSKREVKHLFMIENIHKQKVALTSLTNFQVLGLDGKSDGVGDIAMLWDSQQLVWSGKKHSSELNVIVVWSYS